MMTEINKPKFFLTGNIFQLAFSKNGNFILREQRGSIL